MITLENGAVLEMAALVIKLFTITVANVMTSPTPQLLSVTMVEPGPILLNTRRAFLPMPIIRRAKSRIPKCSLIHEAEALVYSDLPQAYLTLHQR